MNALTRCCWLGPSNGRPTRASTACRRSSTSLRETPCIRRAPAAIADDADRHARTRHGRRRAHELEAVCVADALAPIERADESHEQVALADAELRPNALARAARRCVTAPARRRHRARRAKS